MAVEPVGHEGAIALDVGPGFAAVGGAGFDDQPGGGTRGSGALHEEMGLLDRHERIGVAVDDEGRRHPGGHEADGGKRFTEFLAAFGRGGFGAEGADVVLEDADAGGDFALAAVVEKVGGRIEAGDGLDRAAGAIDRIAGVGGSGASCVPRRWRGGRRRSPR